MTTNKKRLPIILAIITIMLIITLPLFFKNKKQTAKSTEPQTSPSTQILGENIASVPSPAISPSPTPTKKSPTPKPSSGQAPSISITPISSPIPMPTPIPTPVPAKTVTVDIQNLGLYTVEISGNDTAYDVLIKAGKQNNFTITSEYYTGMGYFVSGINGIGSHDNYFWAFYYNGVSSMVGASGQKVQDKDTTAWKFESW